MFLQSLIIGSQCSALLKQKMVLLISKKEVLGKKQISLQPIRCLNDFAVIRGKSKKYLLFFKMNSIDFGFVLKGERVVFKEIATLP